MTKAQTSPDSSGAKTLFKWREKLTAPVIAAPMFLVSSPELVAAQCTSGIIGTFPALNARPTSQLRKWLEQIVAALAAWDRDRPGTPSAPFGVNLIVHSSNTRLDDELAICAEFKVPLVISSMGARREVNEVVQGYGGVTLHDVTNQRHARKAIEAGATGLVAVAAGAGGHAGALSPFALVEEIRQWFVGPLALAGAIGTGRAIAAARMVGADFAYVGSAFIPTDEASCPEQQKAAVVAAGAEDVVYTPMFSGTPANYLRSSIEAAGLDPDNLSTERRKPDLRTGTRAAKTWTDIWGCGQGAGSSHAVEPAAAVAERLAREYHVAMQEAARCVGETR